MKRNPCVHRVSSFSVVAALAALTPASRLSVVLGIVPGILVLLVERRLWRHVSSCAS
jgi:hypothetical protein